MALEFRVMLVQQVARRLWYGRIVQLLQNGRPRVHRPVGRLFRQSVILLQTSREVGSQGGRRNQSRLLKALGDSPLDGGRESSDFQAKLAAIITQKCLAKLRIKRDLDSVERDHGRQLLARRVAEHALYCTSPCVVPKSIREPLASLMLLPLGTSRISPLGSTAFHKDVDRFCSPSIDGLFGLWFTAAT